MVNVLVTGGAGFIGSHAVVELINAGFEPIIIDNFCNSDKKVISNLEDLLDRKITSYEIDFTDTKALTKIINDQSIDSVIIDSVIHFAAFKAVGESVEQPLKYYDNNVSGLITLLDIIEKAGINKLVFSSSCTVYGNPKNIPVTEESPTPRATSPYGATKQMSEIIIEDTCKASKSLRALSLRYFNPIGAHPTALIGELPIGTPNCLIPYVTQTAAGVHKQLTIHGGDYETTDGTCIRDYIHVVDLAKAHVKALEYLTGKSTGFSDVFNIGTGKGVSVLEIVKTFERVNNIVLPYRIGPRRSGDVEAVFAATDKARKTLKWKAEKTLEEALRDAWRWQNQLKSK